MTTTRPVINDPYNAFCQDSDAWLPGGPLVELSLAAKDIFDVAGHVTGGGNRDWKATHGPTHRNAWIVQALVDAGAAMVGKTSYHTIGWSARDIDTFAWVAEALFAGQDLDRARPTRLVIAQDAFQLAEPEVAEALLPLARHRVRPRSLGSGASGRQDTARRAGQERPGSWR